MAYLRIYCDYCGQKWDVYQRNMKDDSSRVCPHCMAEIDPQTWVRQIVPALCMVADANQELFRDHLEYHKPVFTFDVKEDYYFSRKKIESEGDDD